MRVSAAWIDPSTRRGRIADLDVPEGATAGDALRIAGVAADGIAVSGERCGPDRILREGDRVDAGFPLDMTPVQARALRARRGQGSRSTPYARHGGKHQLVKP